MIAYALYVISSLGLIVSGIMLDRLVFRKHYINTKQIERVNVNRFKAIVNDEGDEQIVEVNDDYIGPKYIVERNVNSVQYKIYEGEDGHLAASMFNDVKVRHERGIMTFYDGGVVRETYNGGT